MKALFGGVSLLVALAIVALVATRQLKSTLAVGGASAPQASLPSVPQMSASGSLREQSQQLQSKIASDLTKAMEQGAAARASEAEKP